MKFYFFNKIFFVFFVASLATISLFGDTVTTSGAKDFVRYCTGKNYKSVDDVVLTANITLSDDMLITKNLKIRSKDGARYTITANNARQIKVNPGYTLTLTNIVFDGKNSSRRTTGIFYLNESSNTNQIARLELKKGTTIQSFTVTTTADADHAVIHAKKSSRIIIDDGAEILDCHNKSAHGNGGAICCDSGNIIMNGGVIANCSAKGSGGAIRVTGARNTAEDHIGVAMRGDIVLYGGYITNNICGEGSAFNDQCYGGGIYLGDTGPMLHIVGPVVVSNNICKVKQSSSYFSDYDEIPDDVSTFELKDDYANRLKLTTDESHYQLKFTNGWVGVRYPDSRTLGDDDVQDKRFGGVWEYETTLQDEARQFFWNGDSTHKHRGWMKGNALVWSRFHMHELPRDAMKINELLSDEDHANEPVYVELTDDYTMRQEEGKTGIVGDGRRLIIDLQGHHFVSNLQVDSGGQIEITDSSTNRAGKVSGNYVSTADEGSDNRKKAYILHGGSYDKKPPSEWVSEECVVIGNYCEVHPWMVARLAWETNLTSRVADVTLVPLESVDNEIRDVVNISDDVDEITYSTGDWVRNAHTNMNYHVRVLAAPAISNETSNVLEEIGPRVVYFDTAEDGIVDHNNIQMPDNQPQILPSNDANDGSAISYGREDTFIWKSQKYDLIKLIHITYRKSGSVETTNAIEQAYFRFPKAAFAATQRKTNGQLPITVVDQLLGSLGYNRAAGFSQGDVNATLDAKENNGLRKWENIVTGTAADHLLVSSVEESDNITTLKVSMTEPNKSHRGDTGYSVFYDLKKSTENGWVRVGEVMDKPEFSVELIGEDGKSKNASGFYRVSTLIVPDDTLSVTNEIPSTNIIGVLEVASSFNNTMAAVPWVALSREKTTLSNEPLTISKYLHTKQLENEDWVRVANNGFVYQSWFWNAGEKKWEGLHTATGSEVVSPADPASHQLSRSSATWVTRSNPAGKPFFIVGQYSPDDITLTVAAGEANKPTCTLIPNPSLEPVEINKYPWGENPCNGDQIRIVNEKEAPVLLFWRNGKWMTWVVGEDKVSYLKDDVAVPAGQGFWYQRCGSAFELKLPASKPFEE